MFGGTVICATLAATQSNPLHTTPIASLACRGNLFNGVAGIHGMSNCDTLEPGFSGHLANGYLDKAFAAIEALCGQLLYSILVDALIPCNVLQMRRQLEIGKMSMPHVQYSDCAVETAVEISLHCKIHHLF